MRLFSLSESSLREQFSVCRLENFRQNYFIYSSELPILRFCSLFETFAIYCWSCNRLCTQIRRPENFHEFKVNTRTNQSKLFQTSIYKQMYNTASEEVLLLIADSDTYEANTKPFFKKANNISNIIHTFEGRIKILIKSYQSIYKLRLPSTQWWYSTEHFSDWILANLQKFERIQIPTFDDDNINFFNFKILFENLVHNND